MAVDMAIATGDCFVRRIHGKDLFFMGRAMDYMENTDTSERVVTGTATLDADQDGVGDMFKSLLEARPEELGETGWVTFVAQTGPAAIEDKAASAKAAKRESKKSTSCE